MRTFVVKLAVWHRVFKDLEDARLRLVQVQAAPPRDARAGKYGRTFVAFSELAILLLANFEPPLTLTLQRGVSRLTRSRFKNSRPWSNAAGTMA
jgi:hypothetical protein